MRKINEFPAMVTKVTISQWSYKQNGMQLKRTNKADNVRIDGNVRIYCLGIAQHSKWSATPGAMIEDENGYVPSMKSFVVEISLHNVREWVNRLISAATNGRTLEDIVNNGIAKYNANSEVYHINVNDTRTVYDVKEITEEFDEDYFCVDYKKDKDGVRKLLYSTRDKFQFKTRHMTCYAVSMFDQPIVSEEAAVASWHSSHATQKEVAERNSVINERRRPALPKSNDEKGDGVNAPEM